MVVVIQKHRWCTSGFNCRRCKAPGRYVPYPAQDSHARSDQPAVPSYLRKLYGSTSVLRKVSVLMKAWEEGHCPVHRQLNCASSAYISYCSYMTCADGDL